MAAEKPEVTVLERLLAEMAPPRVPDTAFDRENVELFKITAWKKTFAISVLAGLLTEPRYYANGIRLDWLQRLVFSKAGGRRKPTPEEIGRALNGGLERAKVLRLEDPSEDLFCDLITTQKGNFRIFTGQWEMAGPYTQTLLDAFHALPDGGVKQDVLGSVYAALRLSDELAERAGVVPLSETSGTPQGIMTVPNIDALKRLARRVKFSDADLASAGVDKAALRPFIMEPQHYPYVSDRAPGDTPLEFHPLVETFKGIILASPAAISLAIRACLISAAKRGGLEKMLLYLLLKRQERYSNATGFWPRGALELSPPDAHLLRIATRQYASGHYLQVVQVPVRFESFPQTAFGSVAELNEDLAKAVADHVHQFWKFLAQQPDYRKSVTVILTSGWGVGVSMVPPIDHREEPEGWQFVYLSFADTAILGACEDGKFSDIARILQQECRLEAEGFEFQNPNGILNLFGYWRSTDGHLIPEHFWQIAPPCFLSMPTDDLLIPRVEALRKTDVRALPLPGEGFKTVQRVDGATTT